MGSIPGNRPSFGEESSPSTGAGLSSSASAGTLTEKAGDIASSAVEMAKGTASSAAAKVQEAATAVAGKTAEVAGNLTEKAECATAAVADTVSAGTRYVREQGVSGMLDDVTTLMRRYPVPTLAVGFTLGLLLSRLRRD